jgi:uncharacterized protein (DUF983 family)
MSYRNCHYLEEEKLMKKVELAEAKTVNGGARWYCPNCGYYSNWHAFLSTAKAAAYDHHRATGYTHHPYAFN